MLADMFCSLANEEEQIGVCDGRGMMVGRRTQLEFLADGVGWLVYIQTVR